MTATATLRWSANEEAEKMRAPCYKCESRSLGCHSECELYKAFDTERVAERQQRRTEYAITAVRGESCARYKERERATPTNLIRRK